MGPKLLPEHEMKVRVTEEGVLIPRRMLGRAEEVEIRRERGGVLIVPLELVDGERGRLMFQALEGLASSGGVSEIPDPTSWERELREDRALPDRD